MNRSLDNVHNVSDDFITAAAPTTALVCRALRCSADNYHCLSAISCSNNLITLSKAFDVMGVYKIEGASGYSSAPNVISDLWDTFRKL